MSHNLDMNAGRESDGQCTTCEGSEQRWKSLTRGGPGGKATDQGEHGAGSRVPDAKLGKRVSWAAPCAGSSKE